MPFPLANLSKRTIRADVASLLGDLWPLTTSGAGNTGGTTAVFSSLIGEPVASISNRYLVLESGANDSTWRIASNAFAPTTGTITVRRAYAAQVVGSVTAHLHVFAPDQYTRAINEAIRELYKAVYRPILQHSFVRDGFQRNIPLGRNMERVMRVMEDASASEKITDYFDRADSTTTAGTKWTASVGTWGVSSEHLYSVTDADADVLLAQTNPQVKDGVLQYVLRGTLNSGVIYRTPAVLFRYDDSANYLLLRLLNGNVDLRKNDRGTESSLTTGAITTSDGVDYTVRVMFEGSWIRVWVDDVELITYELTGLNLKYLGYDESGTGTYGNVGLRWDKAGAPATAARVADYFLHTLVGRVERGDWIRSYDGRMLELNTMHRGSLATPARMLWIEGLSPLSTLAADTFETITSDSTATVEIQTADPAYQLLLLWSKYCLLRDAGAPGYFATSDQLKQYVAQAVAARAEAEEARKKLRMRYELRAFR